MKSKIERLLKRFQEVEDLLGSPESIADQNLYRELTQEHSYLSELKETWDFLQKIERQVIENQDLLLTETDPEMQQVVKEEIQFLKNEREIYHKKIETLLVPPDPRDNRNVIVEIRAGTGGEEAALFVSDLAKMYRLYADHKGWKYEVITTAESERGGYKEYSMSLSGPNVFRLMQYEGGTHRVQRVPETETSGRLHTSAATVAVLMEPTEEEGIKIDEKDLEIDTFRASGAGGQHVNVTDSAVRLTHKPTGIVVGCQDERSQHKNKEKAMRLLKAKILDEKRKKQMAEISELRSSQVGTGDRSERIRTYNYPQNRITDHRIDLTLYKLDHIMAGDLDDITQALVSYFYQQKLLSE